MMDLIEQIASDRVIDLAFQWLCDRRRDYSAHDDVWRLRADWDEIKPRLQEQLRTGTYRLAPVRRIRGTEESLEVWEAQDALVLKAVAIVLTERLLPELSTKCYHVAGRGGAKAAVREAREHLSENGFVYRTDVKSYYASIDHELLLERLAECVHDERVLDLCRQYLRRTVYHGGRYEDVTQGIALGCPLSPLMGALYLKPLDDAVEATGLFYARFMDDWVVLAPSRWRLRRVVKQVNQILADLKICTHPEKTFVGRTERGFDFLGYEFLPGVIEGDSSLPQATRFRLQVSPRAWARFVERFGRLYEQGADNHRLGQYVRRWMIWVRSGLHTQLIDLLPHWPIGLPPLDPGLQTT